MTPGHQYHFGVSLCHGANCRQQLRGAHFIFEYPWLQGSNICIAPDPFAAKDVGTQIDYDLSTPPVRLELIRVEFQLDHEVGNILWVRLAKAID
ncbi:HrpA-like RNA helicase [Pseudomonas syringae pv. actinidiae]|uniref:HrpA-like RNA helicase n=1 Tax=Pseudomonas syringae pv. actinidiae TaxID=103796 RepID=A0AAN4QCC7_PSESF|nr:HrpA-like RNA helicase [Pseudomonas syringae pv. actinidiae]